VEDLIKEDLKELIIFYKNKSVEMEWLFLLQQIKYNNMVKEKENEKILEIEKLNKHYSDESIADNTKYELIIDFLKKEIEKKDKEILKLKNKKSK